MVKQVERNNHCFRHRVCELNLSKCSVNLAIVYLLHLD